MSRSVTDDRGFKRNVVASSLALEDADGHRVPLAGRVQLLVMSPLGFGVGVGAVITGAFWLGNSIRPAPTRSPVMLAGFLVLVGVLAGVGWAVQQFFEWQASPVHRKRLANRQCAACGYDLRAQPADPDGCTVCPECGAAWRLIEADSERGGRGERRA